MASALVSVVSSLPPFEALPTSEFKEMANLAKTKVKAWKRGARKGKG